MHSVTPADITQQHHLHLDGVTLHSSTRCYHA